MRWMLALAAAAMVGAAAWWWASSSAEADKIAMGAALYTEHCASCHGAGLEGEANWRERRPSGELPAPPHDESGHTWHHADQYLFNIVKYGIAPYAPPGYVSTMTGFGEKLSDDQIAAVLAFIKSRWPDSVRERQKALSR